MADFDCDLPAAVGNTPLVELTRLNPNRQVRIFAKLEGNNPGGSVKAADEKAHDGQIQLLPHP